MKMKICQEMAFDLISTSKPKNAQLVKVPENIGYFSFNLKGINLFLFNDNSFL